jgi:predicted anti-sigma-YlaC factor YlaD
MNVTREVILDLLPVYLAGEASPATKALVEEYMQGDPELRERIRLQWAEGFEKVAPTDLPPDLELRSLRRTRKLLGWQRWLLGFAIGFCAFALSNQSSWEGGHLKEFHFLIRDYPVPFVACLLVGIACWIGYFSIRRRLRTAG